MTIARSLKALLAASVCLLPLQALAQSDDDTGFDVGEKQAAVVPPSEPDNWVQIGAQYDSNRSYYLGRFSGAENPGFYGAGDFHLGGRDAWDSGGTQYWSLDGKDMGLDSRSFSAKVGNQGTWGAWFTYDGIPYEASDDYHSVWTSTGVSNVGYATLPLNNYPAKAQFPAVTVNGSPYVQNGTILPALFFPTPSATLSSSLLDYNIATRRDIFAAGGKYQWDDWTISVSVRHDHKTGYQANSLEIGGTVSLSGTGTGAAKNTAPTAGMTSGLGYFAMPIDYDIDRYDVDAQYANERFQVQLGYMFSNFTDNIADVDLINPFALGALSSGSYSGTGTTPAGVSGVYSLPPSNSAQQIKAELGYNIDPTTRVNANFAYGLQVQNASYVQGSGLASLSETEPRASFDGLVHTYFGNVAIVSQPLPKVDVRLAYTIDDRDNQSPSNLYQVDSRSNGQLNAGGDCAYTGGLCRNLPFSFDHQMLTGEVGYRIFPQTKVTLNDTFDVTYRNYANATRVTANTATLRLRSQLNDDLFGSISVAHQDRVADNYGISNTWTDLTGGGVSQGANFMTFFEASRRHDEVKTMLDWSPAYNVTVSLMGKAANDVYPGGSYGLRNNNNLSVGPDVAWDVKTGLTMHAYYTYQQVYYETGTVYSSGNDATSGYYIPYTQKTTDGVHSAGVTMDWVVIPKVFKVGLNYTFSYGDTAYALGDGMAVIGASLTSQSTLAQVAQVTALPDVTSMLNMISIRGEYTFRPNWTLIFGYAFERFNYKDFMNDISSTEYANALLPGTLNPNDSVHVVGAGLRVRF